MTVIYVATPLLKMLPFLVVFNQCNQKRETVTGFTHQSWSCFSGVPSCGNSRTRGCRPAPAPPGGRTLGPAPRDGYTDQFMINSSRAEEHARRGLATGISPDHAGLPDLELRLVALVLGLVRSDGDIGSAVAVCSPCSFAH